MYSRTTNAKKTTHEPFFSLRDGTVRYWVLRPRSASSETLPPVCQHFLARGAQVAALDDSWWDSFRRKIDACDSPPCIDVQVSPALRPRTPGDRQQGSIFMAPKSASRSQWFSRTQPECLADWAMGCGHQSRGSPQRKTPCSTGGANFLREEWNRFPVLTTAVMSFYPPRAEYGRVTRPWLGHYARSRLVSPTARTVVIIHHRAHPAPPSPVCQ